MLKLTEHEARSQYPDLVMTALGANRKDNPDRVVSARVPFDWSDGSAVNRRTRIGDQERAVLAADLKRVMHEKARLGEKTFALTAGVAEAHSQTPIHPREWHLLGCQIEAGGDVYVNKVGTFGAASASYYWSRAASAIGRLTQYLTGRSANTWHQSVADDFHFEASRTEYSAALVSFVLCSTAGVPISWGKTAGGDKVAWVGFELLHSTYHLDEASSVVHQVGRRGRQLTVSTATFEEGLSRLMYLVGALEHARPFLSPPDCFLSLHPKGVVRKVPAYVKYFLRYPSRQVSQSRHYDCAMVMRPWKTTLQTGIGCWAAEPVRLVQPQDHQSRVAVDLRAR